MDQDKDEGDKFIKKRGGASHNDHETKYKCTVDVFNTAFKYVMRKKDLSQVLKYLVCRDINIL